MKKLLLSLLVLFFMPFWVAGCWDMIGLEKHAFVISLGIDTVEEDEKKEQPGSPPLSPPQRLHLTMEVFNPRLYKMNKDKHSIILHQSASSLDEALKLAQSQIAGRISLVHLRSLVIGEEYARQGIKEVIDTLQRSPKIASRFRIAFVQGSRAEDVMEAPAPTEGNTAEIFTKIGERDPAYGFHSTISFNDLLVQLKSCSGTAYCTRLHLSNNRWIQKIGAAVLKDWKLAGWLNPYEARSTNWITGRMDQTSVSVENEEMLVFYEATRATSRIITSLRGGRPHFLVTVKTDGILSGISEEPSSGITREYLEKIETAAAQKINAEIRWAVEKAQQEFRTDYLGFNQALKNSYPAVYNSLNWEETFPTVPVDVEVQAHITRLGTKE